LAYKRERGLLYFLGRQAEWIGAGLLLLFTLIIELDLSNKNLNGWPDFILKGIGYTQQWSFYILVAIVFISMFAVVVNRLPDKWVWEKLKFVLDEFQKKAYVNHLDDRTDDHRITLFQYKKFAGFRFKHNKTTFSLWGENALFGGWLVPVLRSGHRSLNTKAIFRAPLQGESEGVVGLCWDNQRSPVVDELPRVVRSTSDEQRDKYARRTFSDRRMIDDYVEGGKPLPRAIGAIPVFVNGEIWGVLVLDSQAKNGVTQEVLDNFSLTVEIIGQLLERG